MPQRTGPRLDGRNREILVSYLSGATQAEIAEEHGLGQQHVSEILAAERGNMSRADRSSIAETDLLRTEILLNACVKRFLHDRDTAAGALALRLMERRAKAIGSDAAEPLSVVLTRRNDEVGQLIGHVLVKTLAPLANAATGDESFRRELVDYASLLAQRELLSVDAPEGTELPPVPDPPQRPAPPTAEPRGTGQPGRREQPKQTVAELKAEYEAVYGPLGGEDYEDDEDEA